MKRRPSRYFNVLIYSWIMLLAFAVLSHADNMLVELPYGIGSVQLPWQSTEGIYGLMRPIKGGIWHQVVGVSLPIVTLGRLPSGYRIIDGSLGGVLAVPNNGAQPDAYGGLGHDLVQDIAPLKGYKSFHWNIGTSYANAAQGWNWGMAISYAFWEGSNTSQPTPPASSSPPNAASTPPSTTSQTPTPTVTP